MNFGDYIRVFALGTRLHGTWTEARFNYPGYPRDPDVFYRGMDFPFADNFDDAVADTYFFSNPTTGARWAVAPIAIGSLCDLPVRTVAGTDRACEVRFSGIEGVNGTSYSAASYKGTYTPNGQPETIFIRVTTPGSANDLSNSNGRIVTGVIGQNGLATDLCAAAQGASYQYHVVASSVFAGIDLDADRRRPVITFTSSPNFYHEVTFAPISLTGVVRLTIAVKFTATGVTVTLTNSDTDALLAEGFTVYPNGFTFAGTHAGAFKYSGVANNNGTLEVRDFTVHIP